MVDPASCRRRQGSAHMQGGKQVLRVMPRESLRSAACSRKPVPTRWALARGTGLREQAAMAASYRQRWKDSPTRRSRGCRGGSSAAIRFRPRAARASFAISESHAAPHVPSLLACFAALRQRRRDLKRCASGRPPQALLAASATNAPLACCATWDAGSRCFVLPHDLACVPPPASRALRCG